MGSRQKRVAVIGAGVSGVATAKYLLSSGLDVVIFERSKTAGGNW
jgi:cation diffusion facilitator CzcD-associated flavoprotein CzcO